MKFSIGQQVIQKDTIKAKTSYNVQRVVGYLDGSVLLEWYGFGFDGEIQREDFLLDSKPGTRSWREGIQRFQESELFTVEEAHAELRRLETIKSKMDEEFDVVRTQIQAKMNQAAELVKVASSLAEPFDKNLSDLKAECMSLYNAINDGGWRHSHMSC